jgi:hypothetical protein
MINTTRILAAAILIIGAGLVHGSWTNRWRPSRALANQAARLDAIPTVIGDWTGTPFAVPAPDLAMAGAVNYMARRYTNPRRDVTLTVLMLCGLPGDISLHTPEACYPGAGFTLGDTAVFTRTYGSPEHRAEFRTAVATRAGTNPAMLRIFWGWNASKGWLAPQDARWTFASEPALCKLYVVRETAGSIPDPSDDACNQFLTLLLPALDRSVFSDPQ